MKKTTVIVWVIAALSAATSMTAWSQPQAAASATASGQAASAMDASGAAAPIDRQADRALRRKVYAAIGTERSINAGKISVRAKNGVVTLTGSVSDTSQIGKVEEIAKGVAGVTSVTNKLSVTKSFGGM